VFDENYPILIA